MIYYEAKDIVYINKIYVTHLFHVIERGLLRLWNNVSVYDLQLIIIKICEKIFKLKLVTKLSKYFFSQKILKLFDFIGSFFMKINLKVKNIYLRKFYFKLILLLFFRFC
jgi:hypothetical protein